MRLAKGMFGQEVNQLQAALNVRQDGEFGAQTRQAVRDWQRANGFEVTGEVNQQMWTALIPPPPPVVEVISKPVVQSTPTIEDGPKQDKTTAPEVNRIPSGSGDKNTNRTSSHSR